MKCLAHMLSTGLFAAATLPSALAFTWSHSNIKRATYAASDATLYAYGTNISGLEILYGVSDGMYSGISTLLLLLLLLHPKS